MTTKLIPSCGHKRSNLLHIDRFDLSTTIFAGRTGRILSIDGFGTSIAEAYINVATAYGSRQMAKNGAYCVDAGGFNYQSLDGKFIVLNEEAITGSIVDADTGPGVIVQIIPYAGCYPSTLHRKDETIE